MASDDERTLDLANRIAEMVVAFGKTFESVDDSVDHMYSALFTASIGVLQNMFCREHAKYEGHQLAYMSTTATSIHFEDAPSDRRGQGNVMAAVTNILYAGLACEDIDPEQDEDVISALVAAILLRKIKAGGQGVTEMFMAKVGLQIAAILASHEAAPDLANMDPMGRG